MSTLSTLVLTSSDELREHGVAWDELWERAAVTHPTAQAALIRVWLEHFRACETFRAVIVREGDRFVAALPLVTRHKKRFVRCLDVPGNEWSSAGQLLLDPHCDMQAVCRRLVQILEELEDTAFWFASVPIEAPWWGQLVSAARSAGWSVDARERYRVGRLAWDPRGVLPSRSVPPGIRKKMGQSLHRLRRDGPVRLHITRPRSEQQAWQTVAAGWTLEQASWKGAAGTSVLSNPSARDYLRDQARQLIRRGQLVLAILEHQGWPVAFEYGWYAKEVYHSYKVAYDPRFARSSPGQLLVYHLLEHFERTGEVRAIDFLGPLDTAVARWQPQTYAMGRLLMAPPKTLGTAVVWAASHLPSHASAGAMPK